MIIVGMCPAGRVHLPCRNAHRTECRHEESRFFPTTPVCGFYRGKGRTGPCVRRLVVRLLMTPMVHFEYGIIHRQAFEARHQFIMEYHPRTVERLIVHPHRKDEMAEHLIGYRLPPSRFFARGERASDILQIKLAGIIGDITHRHIRIQEHQGIPLFGRKPFRINHLKEIPLGKQGFLLLEIRLHLLLERRSASRQKCAQHTNAK